MTTDGELLAGIRRGEEAALTQLYTRYSERVYNLALLHLQRTEEAEEVTQDVFLEVFRSAAKFRGDSEIMTWLYRITVNKARDQLRRNQAQKRSTWLRVVRSTEENPILERIPDFDHPGVQLEKREEARHLFRAIYQLNDRQKTAIILCLVENLPRKEAAEIMGVSLKSLEGLLQRGKVQLRKLLRPPDKDEPQP